MPPRPTVIIYRLGSLGDTIVALPCFHAIKAAFPTHRRVVLTNFPVSSKAAPLQEILQPGGFIDDVIAYHVGVRRLAELARIRRELKASGADTLIFLGGGRGLWRVYRDCLFFRLCGFKHIIGAPWTPDLEYARLRADEREEPEAERLARCLSTLGPIDLDDPAVWDLNLSQAELQEAERFLGGLAPKPFIAINTGGKIADKDWGEENWFALLQSLTAALPGVGLVSIGAAEDEARADRLRQAWQGPILSGCGRLSARQSAAVLAKACLFVGHDSGPLHLASAVATPTVSLFGSLNRPGRWHPYGRGHVVLHDVRGVGFSTPQAVHAAVVATLESTRPSVLGRGGF
jgi:heptosyltransferase-3